MILQSTTRKTSIYAGLNNPAQPQEGTYFMRGQEHPMVFDGKVEPEIADKVFLDKAPTDIQQLKVLRDNPSVDKAEQLLDQGARQVDVDLGELGDDWIASRDGEVTSFKNDWDVLNQVELRKKGDGVALKFGRVELGDRETISQKIVGKFNENGTITLSLEEVENEVNDL